MEQKNMMVTKTEGAVSENKVLFESKESEDHLDESMQGVKLDSLMTQQLKRPEALIDGVLCQGHKMILSGSYEAGKSSLLMELCAAIAEGGSWLGFPCKQGRVLYIDLESDPGSCLHRVQEICQKKAIKTCHMENIKMLNLRGNAEPLNQLVTRMTRRVREEGFVAVVLDPVNNVLTNHESNPIEICNLFDRMCMETGCSVIYSHHYSKCARGAKPASGSEVLLRDADAQLDMIQLNLTDKAKALAPADTATAWRLEGSLRHFAPFRPVNFWYEYPTHQLDITGILASMK